MRIVLLTQDDPFYLGKNIRYLLQNMPHHSEIVGTVLFDVSPFGKRESFKDKMLKTYKVFGFRFFVYYGIKFIKAKINKSTLVKEVLSKFKVPLIQINGSVNSQENRDKISSFKPDLLISIGGNQIFKKKLIELAPKGCLNLHTALLPKYRGLMPSFWVLKNNEKYTGVSVFFVDEGIDSGPILVQKKIEIGNRTQEKLIEDSKKIGMECILEAISKINEGQVDCLENNNDEMTYFSFPNKTDVQEFYTLGQRFF